MGYTNRTSDIRRGLPVGLVALILGLVLFGGLSGPTPAYAVAISCGGCHSMPPNERLACRTTIKNHPAHSTATVATCDRCHAGSNVAGTGYPSLAHIDGFVKITSFDRSSPGLRYVSGSRQCSGNCHANQSYDIWGGTRDCNRCHFRKGAIGLVAPSGLHVDAAKAYKHYSSTIKVTNNTSTITCTNCHPNNEADVVPMTHIKDATFANRANLSTAFQNVTVTGVGYTKGGTQGTGTCTQACHNNSADTFGNKTTYFSPTKKVKVGAYAAPKWNDTDMACNECHSTPSQSASGFAGNSSTNANKHHQRHMQAYKLDTNILTGADANIYCYDCHRFPDPAAAVGSRVFLGHSTTGQGASGKISLPVKSRNAKVNLVWASRNGGKGANGTTNAVFNSSGVTCTNVYCHSTVASTVVLGWGAAGCTDCHGKKDGVKAGTGAPGYRNWTSANQFRTFEEYSGAGGAHYMHVVTRGYPCKTCHATGGMDTPANHNQGVGTVTRANVNVGIDTKYNFKGSAASYNTSTRTCSNVKCHYGTSLNWDCAPLH